MLSAQLLNEQLLQLVNSQIGKQLTSEKSNNELATIKKEPKEEPIEKQKNEEQASIISTDEKKTIRAELEILIRKVSEQVSVTKDLREELQNDLKLLPTKYTKMYEAILTKFTEQKKTKEELVKFIIRKCFKFLKIKLQMNVSSLPNIEVEKKFYRQFFNEDSGAEELIPFRQNSKLKTMNAQYLKKIFQSDLFCQSYKEYLEKFDQVWEEEKEDKIENMIKQMEKAISEQDFKKITTYRRLPWLVNQKQKCLLIAQSLLEYTSTSGQSGLENKI